MLFSPDLRDIPGLTLLSLSCLASVFSSVFLSSSACSLISASSAFSLYIMSAEAPQHVTKINSTSSSATLVRPILEYQCYIYDGVHVLKFVLITYACYVAMHQSLGTFQLLTNPEFLIEQ